MIIPYVQISKINDSLKKLNMGKKPVAFKNVRPSIMLLGFIDKDDDHGLSPDGIIKDMYGKYTEALEIKCPRGKNYMKYYIEGVLPSDYKHQVINYFLVMSDLKLLHFMIFNPETIKDFPTYKIIEVTREELQDDLKKAEQKLDAFKQKFNQVKNEINRNKTIQK